MHLNKKKLQRKSQGSQARELPLGSNNSLDTSLIHSLLSVYNYLTLSLTQKAKENIAQPENIAFTGEESRTGEKSLGRENAQGTGLSPHHYHGCSDRIMKPRRNIRSTPAL